MTHEKKRLELWIKDRCGNDYYKYEQCNSAINILDFKIEGKSLEVVYQYWSNQALIDFANALESVCIETVEEGKMTKDLAVCIHGNKVSHGEHYLYTEEFLDELDKGLKASLGQTA
jgi:hypothetical protein